jgi:hypothetical protein
MSFLGSIGNAIKGGVKDIGGLAEKAAPFAGMIPGVGTLAGGALGGLGALAHGDGFGGALKYGAEGALSGYGGGLLRGGADAATTAADATGDTGGGFLSNVGNMLKSGGSAIAKNFKNPDGSMNIGKLVAAGGAGMNMIGQAKQRNSAQNYNNSQIDQRNKLMSQIMTPQNLNLPSITPAGAGTTPGAQASPLPNQPAINPALSKLAQARANPAATPALPQSPQPSAY